MPWTEEGVTGLGGWTEDTATAVTGPFDMLIFDGLVFDGREEWASEADGLTNWTTVLPGSSGWVE